MTPEQQEALRRARQRAALQRAEERLLGGVEPAQQPPVPQDLPPDALGARAAAGEGVMPFVPGQTMPQLSPQDQAWVDETGDTLRRNVMGGSEPGQETFGENLGTLLNMGGESLSFGLIGDEAAAGADALIGRGSYDDRRDFYRGEEQRLEEEMPGTSMAARIAPMLIPGAAGAGFAARGGNLATKALRSGALGGAGGATYGFMEGEGGAEQRAQSALQTGLMGGAVGAAVPVAGAIASKLAGGGQRAANMNMARTTEGADDLTARASQLYDQARAQGVTAGRDQTQALAGSIRRVASDEGLITPAGRVAESYPRLRDVLNMVDDFAEGTMDPAQMQAVRRTLQGAARSADGNERRIGTALLRKFDDWVEPLAPQFREANQLYARASRGQEIDKAVELAGVRAGQFSGSGFENALRTEFRRLSRDIAKGKMRGLTEDQISAIKRVADGGSVENALRALGKFAPTGVVSAAGGGGLGYLIGNTMGGPGLGAAVAGTTMGLGALGRAGATAMQKGNANVASALMRSPTGQLPPPQIDSVSPIVKRLLFSGSPIGQQIQGQPR